jgi:hypothetical protein
MSKKPSKQPANATKKIDPVDIYRHGLQFFWAIDTMHGGINREPARGNWIGLPILVTAAFASEIFLKCLICVETGKSVTGHNLKKLFDALTPATRKIVTDKWDRVMVGRKEVIDTLERNSGQRVPRDLNAVLKESADTFVILRYAYEPGRDFRSLISDLPIPLKETILQIRPEWGNI